MKTQLFRIMPIVANAAPGGSPAAAPVANQDAQRTSQQFLDAARTAMNKVRTIPVGQNVSAEIQTEITNALKSLGDQNCSARDALLKAYESGFSDQKLTTTERREIMRLREAFENENNVLKSAADVGATAVRAETAAQTADLVTDVPAPLPEKQNTPRVVLQEAAPTELKSFTAPTPAEVVADKDNHETVI